MGWESEFDPQKCSIAEDFLKNPDVFYIFVYKKLEWDDEDKERTSVVKFPKHQAGNLREAVSRAYGFLRLLYTRCEIKKCLWALIIDRGGDTHILHTALIEKPSADIPLYTPGQKYELSK